MKIGSALTTIGAIGGLAYGVSKRKSFWTTAGFTLVFAIAGAAVGTAINTISE
jgi:hypothetical protein